MNELEQGVADKTRPAPVLTTEIDQLGRCWVIVGNEGELGRFWVKAKIVDSSAPDPVGDDVAVYWAHGRGGNIIPGEYVTIPKGGEKSFFLTKHNANPVIPGRVFESPRSDPLTGLFTTVSSTGWREQPANDAFLEFEVSILTDPSPAKAYKAQLRLDRDGLRLVD